MRFIPCSHAVRIVSRAEPSSVPPHMKPPIDQVPKPMREASRLNPFTLAYSIYLPSTESSYFSQMESVISGSLRSVRLDVFKHRSIARDMIACLRPWVAARADTVAIATSTADSIKWMDFIFVTFS